MRLFMVALPTEICLHDLTIWRQETVHGQTIYHLDPDTILVFSGVGKVNAAAALVDALMRHPAVSEVVNFGSCGSFHLMEPLEVVHATAFQYVDVDATGFGYAINQVPHEPQIFHFTTTWDAVVGTADSFVTRQNYPRFANLDGVDVIDMEGAAIAQVCAARGVNFHAYKVVTDTVFGSPNSEVAWESHLKEVSQLLTNLIGEELVRGREIHPEF